MFKSNKQSIKLANDTANNKYIQVPVFLSKSANFARFRSLCGFQIALFLPLFLLTYPV